MVERSPWSRTYTIRVVVVSKLKDWVEIPDNLRIEAGGDYSAENTIMEDMSVNRARGAKI